MENLTNILTEAEYGGLLQAGLVRLGLDAGQAAEVVRARWPMCGLDVLAELAGRGLGLTVDDLDAWLAETFHMREFPDGEPVNGLSIVLSAAHADRFLVWAIAECRGRPTTLNPEPPAVVVTVAEMLDGLRSEDPEERGRCGFALASSIGAGLRLAGEHREDVEHLIAPRISAVIGRAIAGDHAAADELESLLTADPEHACRPDDRSTDTAKSEANHE